jgi:hypothetical protein
MYQDHVARDEREGKRIETGTNCKIDDQGIGGGTMEIIICIGNIVCIGKRIENRNQLPD